VTVSSGADRNDLVAILCRLFAWTAVALAFAFILNNYLTHWRDWPGGSTALSGGGVFAWLQVAFYLIGVALAFSYIFGRSEVSLRADSERLYGITDFIIRAAFWGVFLIGVADFFISFLRVEGLLSTVFSEQMASDLGRSNYRGSFVHLPLMGLGILIAMVHRGLGFPWLALLVVAAELVIVLSRFVLSYEQALMADLVRFWYAALFLFASAHTLIEEGHVRVDVFYSTFSAPTKGAVNAVGSLLLGVPVCVVILLIGMSGQSAIINGPLLVFETTPTGFGMYVKYWMAAFLGIFGLTMLIQFVGFFLEGVADYRGEPGKRAITPMGA